MVVPRISDIYAALPSLTGKFELEYEGELMGAENVARELIRAVGGRGLLGLPRLRRPRARCVAYFESGRQPEAARRRAVGRHGGAAPEGAGPARDTCSRLGVGGGEPAPVMASAAEFVLEGLYGQKKIGRSDDRGFVAPERHSDADIDIEQPRAACGG